MKERKSIDYRIFNDFDRIVDEKGNQTLNLRKLVYGKNENNVKLDLRKWIIGEDGSEIMGKGVSFMTEEGPHTLVEIMAKEGYGNTKTILNAIKDREDFRSSLNQVLGKEDELYDDSVVDEEDTAFYDPRECLL